MSSSGDDHLLEGEIRRIQTQELKNTLSTIAKHITCLIKAAESRASAGDSPCPTARGGLGRIAETTLLSGAPWTPGPKKDGGSITAAPQLNAALSGDAGGERTMSGERIAASPTTATTGTEAAAADAGVSHASLKSTSNASVTSAPVEVLMRTRVLRRVSSVRQLLLGAATRGGERLAYFSRQMGLPHDAVVAYFEV